MKYRHYAPKAEMIIVEGKTENVIQKINRMSKDKLKAGKKLELLVQTRQLTIMNMDWSSVSEEGKKMKKLLIIFIGY